MAEVVFSIYSLNRIFALLEHIFYTCNQINNEKGFNLFHCQKNQTKRRESKCQQSANQNSQPEKTMVQTKNRNRRSNTIKSCPHNQQGKKEIMMTKFLSILSKVFACLVIVVVPVAKALVIALGNYANKGDAYATV